MQTAQATAQNVKRNAMFTRKGADERDHMRNIHNTLKTMNASQQKKALIALRGAVGDEAFRNRFRPLLANNTSLKPLVESAMQARIRKRRRIVPYATFGDAHSIIQKIRGRMAPNRRHSQDFAQYRKGWRSFTLVEAKVKKSPGDGNCLFYSIAQHLYRMRTGGYAPINPVSNKLISENVRRLREETSSYYAKVRNVQRVITTETGQAMSPLQYSQHILPSGTYGGEEDIIALSKIHRIPIVIYQKTNQSVANARYHGVYRKSSYIIGEEFKQPPLFLLYTPGRGPNPEHSAHYDVLYGIVNVTPEEETPSAPTMTPTRGNGTPPGTRPSTYPSPIYYAGSGSGSSSSSWFPSFEMPDMSSEFIYIPMVLSCVSSIVKIASMNR